MWPETELPHTISECVLIAFTAAVATFSEFKHSLSSESIFLKKLKKTPKPPNKELNIYRVENMLQTLATEKF